MSSPVVAEAVGTPHPQFCAKSVPFGQGSQVILVSPNLRVELLTQGAAVNSVRVRKTATWDAPSCDTDEWIEVCLGYTDASECEEPDNLTGVVCGRFAGRIGDGRFSLNGSEYSTLQNCGKHTLHGGPMGFSRLPWRFLITEGEEEIGVAFHLTSTHLDQGFPGELHVTATYAIPKTTQRAPQLRLNLQAHLSDSTPVNATVVNLANHTYWNLNGVPRAARVTDVCPLPAPITNHCLKLQSIYTLELDADLIPTGGMVPTEGTYHDYQRMRCLEAGMMDGAEDGRGEGYDNPMALETWDHTLREALVLYSPQTKLQMSIQTTNPAVVVYTANGLPATANGARGQRFQKFGAVCMECQYFPNSPNVEAFPSTTLSKGETYSEITVHEFKFSASLPHDVE